MARKRVEVNNENAVSDPNLEVVEETTNKYHKIPSAQPNGGQVSEDDYENMTVEQYIKKQNENKVDFF